MLAVATLTMSVNYIVMLSASVIVGNFVGADGLAGLNVCTPVFGIASFLASLLSVGSALVFSRAMGEFNANRAAGVFSQSFMLALGMGLLIFLVMTSFKREYLELAGVSGAVATQAYCYWDGQCFVLALTPLVLLLEAMVYADGDGLVAALAGITHVVGSIGLSIYATIQMGDAGGVSVGTSYAMVAVVMISMLHFLRTDNHLKLRRYFSWTDLKSTLAASLADSTIYLCWGLLVLIINLFAVSQFGQDSLTLVALAASVVEFSIVFDGVGEALIPLGGMYEGEDNKPALRCLANHSALMATLEGLFFGVVFYVFAPVLASWYGIRGTSQSLLPEAVTLIRTLAFAMPFMGLLMMVNTHFLVVRHIPLAVSVTMMKDFIAPAVCSLVLGLHFGLKGLWIGFALGYVIATIYPFLIVRLRYERERFPWLVRRSPNSINTASSATAVSFLRTKASRFCPIEALQDLFAHTRPEEIFIDLKSSPSVTEPAKLRIILRDSRARSEPDLTHPAARAAKKVTYLNTLGCNRTEYLFESETTSP